MLTGLDFEKKQIAVVLFQEGEKLALSNSNLVVKTAEGKIKFQCTCYRLFLVFAVGHCSLTSAIIQAAKKFGFFIALMTPGFRLYALIGAEKDSNYLLHKKQYTYSGIDFAKRITVNKINNQIAELKRNRDPNDAVLEALSILPGYTERVMQADSLNEMMAYEGLASKLYFRNHFNNVLWQGRQPRIKRDYVNSALDIGYTLLFTYIDALLSAYGFDTFCGVMHQQFYMRKSLVCDLVEPFRPIIDHTLKKGINLHQVREEHFILQNGQWRLRWNESAAYVKLFLEPILERKIDIFLYIQAYYRAFMKELPADQFPIFMICGEK